MRYVDKQFLSQSYGETGNICVQFSSPREKDFLDREWERYIDGSICISDCSKTIYLDFNFEDEETMNKRLEKLDKMIEVLQNARNVLPDMFKEFKELQDKYPKKEG